MSQSILAKEQPALDIKQALLATPGTLGTSLPSSEPVLHLKGGPAWYQPHTMHAQLITQFLLSLRQARRCLGAEGKTGPRVPPTKPLYGWVGSGSITWLCRSICLCRPSQAAPRPLAQEPVATSVKACFCHDRGLQLPQAMFP